MNDLSSSLPSSSRTRISGFPEFLPAQQLLYNGFINTISEGFEAFGFLPLVTPAVERVSDLLSKNQDSDVDKEIYGLSRIRSEKDGGPVHTANGLRFDLTVPLACYVNSHYGQLSFPFRRYAIGPVWRGERPQSGRYRQFDQSDIDIIGDGSLSIHHDAEVPFIMHRILTKLNIGGFVMRINNRKLVQGWLAHHGYGKEHNEPVLRITDKLAKKTQEEVLQSLQDEGGLRADDAESLLQWVQLSGSNAETLDWLQAQGFGEQFNQGVTELKLVFDGMRDRGIPDQDIKIDLSITRGLDYYTGTVYETFLKDHPEVGSICSGGRYENLATHIGTRKLPGVGMSIGVTRLVSRLLQAGLLNSPAATTAPVMVANVDPVEHMTCFQMADELRQAGVNVESYLDEHKLGQQLRYAADKGCQLVLLYGGSEAEQNAVRIKDLRDGSQVLVSRPELKQTVLELLK